MYKKMVPSSKTAANKTKRQKVLKEKIDKKQHGLINSLHKWGEDYYGAEDYYEKPVNSIPNRNHYNDFQKKADK